MGAFLVSGTGLANHASSAARPLAYLRQVKIKHCQRGVSPTQGVWISLAGITTGAHRPHCGQNEWIRTVIAYSFVLASRMRRRAGWRARADPSDPSITPPTHSLPKPRNKGVCPKCCVKPLDTDDSFPHPKVYFLPGYLIFAFLAISIDENKISLMLRANCGV